MDNFNLSICNQLSVPDAKEYIKKYFYPLSSGQHVFITYDENKNPSYEIKEDAIVKSVYFNRLPKVIQTFYFKEYDQIKNITCKINKPFIFGNYINTCPSFLHPVKKYSEYSKDVKSKVNTMLNYLKEIWASNNESQYQFIIKWIANMARGGKNKSVLYLRAEQGIGKSTFTDFLRKHVIGPKLCIESGSQPLISQFNAILFCKLLVIFEELENFSIGQWQGVSTRIKRYATSDTLQFEEKNIKTFVAENISNLIINSNVDAIKDDDGRRFFILDLNNKRKGDRDFFSNIYDNCMNDEVGEAFFNYLQTVDLTGYLDQAFPITKAKEDAVAKRIDSIERFIKDNYILRYRDMMTNLKSLYEEYSIMCESIGVRPKCKIEFNTHLNRLNIVSYKSGNENNKFKYNHKQLLDIGNTNKWMHHTDQYEVKEVVASKVDVGIFTDKEDKDAEIARLKEQVQILTNKNNLVVVDEDLFAKLIKENTGRIGEFDHLIKEKKISRIQQIDIDDLFEMCV